MDSFGIFNVSASALKAQRTRMNVIASNMANAHTTRTEEGGPYKKQDVVFSSFLLDAKKGSNLEGVQVVDIVKDQSPPTSVYDPGHPDADEKGIVAMPNVNIIEEMANMIMAQRAYEANVSAFNISKTMFRKTLEIGR